MTSEAQPTVSRKNTKDGKESDSDGDEDIPFVGTEPKSAKDDGPDPLAFIDDFQVGIQSHINYLEQRKKGILYDRHAPEVHSRWRDRIQTVLKRFRGPATATEASPEHDGKGDFSLCREAAPPSKVHFPEVREFPDGKPRLSFSSCFESGNLVLAKTENPTQYRLLLDFDVNTNGHTQWFYFAVRGGTAGQSVHFSIENMSKPSSLFEQGMRPVAWSVLSGGGWKRRGDDVQYFTNRQKRAGGGHTGEGGQYYCTLSFWYTFEHTDDIVFFAYHYPYTYSYLQDFEARLLRHPYASHFLRRSMLCLTLSGVRCDALEIGEFPQQWISEGVMHYTKDEPGSRKPLAVVTARVHPGEPNASWMAHGFLKFLCSPAPEAQLLRERFIWLIIPMLNPDGVIYGNQRCNLSGVDLNRQFSHPDKALQPTVWHLKDRISKLGAAGHTCELYLDLHGHSRREGVFFYGGSSVPGDPRNARIRLLPKLCTIGSDDFSEEGCEFLIQKTKLSTARLVAFLNLNIELSYTIEASFSGAEQRESNLVQMPTVDTSEAMPDLRRSLEQIASVRGELPRRPPGSKDRPAPPGSKDRPAEATVDASTTNSSSKAILDFTQHRLECVGPTVCRALVAALQLSTQARNRGEDKSFWPLREQFPILESANELLDGKEISTNPYLHFDKLTNAAARKAYAELVRAEEAKVTGVGGASVRPRNQGDGDEEGSDGAPSEDNKSPEQLKEVAEAILLRLRRRRSSIIEDATAGPPLSRDRNFETVVAFGSGFRVPRSTQSSRVRPNSARADFVGSVGAGQSEDAAATLKPKVGTGRPQSASSVVGRVHYSVADQDKSFERCVETLARTLPAEEDEDPAALYGTLDELGLTHMHPLVGEDRYDPVVIQRLEPFKQRKSTTKRQLMPARRLDAKDAWCLDWVSAQCQKSGPATRGTMPPFLPHRPQWARHVNGTSAIEGANKMGDEAVTSLPEKLLELIGNAAVVHTNVMPKAQLASPLSEELLTLSPHDSPRFDDAGSKRRLKGDEGLTRAVDDVSVDDLGKAENFNLDDDDFSSASGRSPRSGVYPNMPGQITVQVQDGKSGMGRDFTPQSSTNSNSIASGHSDVSQSGMLPLYQLSGSAQKFASRLVARLSSSSPVDQSTSNPRRILAKDPVDPLSRQELRNDVALDSTLNKSPPKERPLTDLLQSRPLSARRSASRDSSGRPLSARANTSRDSSGRPLSARSSASQDITGRLPRPSSAKRSASQDKSGTSAQVSDKKPTGMPLLVDDSVKTTPTPAPTRSQKSTTQRRQRPPRSTAPTRAPVWQHVEK